MDKAELQHALDFIMNAQQQKLVVLHEYVMAAQLKQAKVFHLPPIDPDAETRDCQFISVTTDRGEEARLAALKAWGHLYASEGENTRLVFRLPGAVQLASPDADIIAALVDQINEERTLFKNLITGKENPFKNSEERHEFIHQRGLFPMLITLHMYRKIPFASNELSSISFCWANKHAMKNTDKTIQIKALTKAQSHPPKHFIDPSNWIAQLENEKAILDALPADTKLQLRRPLPVQPQAWLVDVEKNRRMIVASTPILILSERNIRIGELASYDSNNVRKSRLPRQTADEPLIDRLWLYLKQ